MNNLGLPKLPRTVMTKSGDRIIHEETIIEADWGRKILRTTDLMRVLIGLRDLLNSIDLDNPESRDFSKENLSQEDLEIVNKRVL